MPETTLTPGDATLRFSRILLSPWARLALLVALLCGAAATVMLWDPRQLLASGASPQTPGLTAGLLCTIVYGLCTVAFAPRPLLNVAAGALLGSAIGTAAALAGTVLGAAISFGLGRLLGREALRPLLRGRLLTSADRQLSEHGLRSMLAIRLFPGVPFAAANYCAAVSRMRWRSFLIATGLGSVPGTVAYVVAGSNATSPASPVFLIALGFITLTGLGAGLVAWRARGRLRARDGRRA